MADSPQKKGFFESIFDDIKATAKDQVEDYKTQAEEQITGWIYEGIVNTLDVFGDNVKKGITKGFYKDKPVPEKYRKRLNSGNGNDRENYSSYYYSPPRARESDSVREDATKVRAIIKDTKQEAKAMIDRIIERIDNDPNNVCTVGKLYSWNGISSSSMMLWKYGWSERDKPLFDVKQVKDGWILVLPTPHRTS